MNFVYNQEKIEQILQEFKIQKNFDLAFALAQKERQNYVYNTAALEGNTMTYPEVQTLLEGVTVGGHKLTEEQQVLNQNESWKTLLTLVKKEQFTLTKDFFCQLHAKVSKEEALEWGKFRSKKVGIGGTEHKPPNPEELDDIFAKGLKSLQQINHPILKGFLFFLFGALNQFFFDGNKRTSRLMLNGILLTNGYPILNLLAKDKLDFNTKMIGFYDTQNATDVLEFLIQYYLNQNQDF